MSAFSARHRRLIRFSLFVLMLLSVVVRPIVINRASSILPSTTSLQRQSTGTHTVLELATT